MNISVKYIGGETPSALSDRKRSKPVTGLLLFCYSTLILWLFSLETIQVNNVTDVILFSCSDILLQKYIRIHIWA